MGGNQLQQALGKGAPGAFGVSAVEPPGSQPDMDPAPERRQVSRVPAIAAVHGTARAPAIRAATTGADAVGGNVKQVGAVRRDRLDTTARHGTKLVHALFYGHDCRCPQTSVANRYNPHKARESHETRGGSVQEQIVHRLHDVAPRPDWIAGLLGQRQQGERVYAGINARCVTKRAARAGDVQQEADQAPFDVA